MNSMRHDPALASQKRLLEPALASESRTALCSNMLLHQPRLSRSPIQLAWMAPHPHASTSHVCWPDISFQRMKPIGTERRDGYALCNSSTISASSSLQWGLYAKPTMLTASTSLSSMTALTVGPGASPLFTRCRVCRLSSLGIRRVSTLSPGQSHFIVFPSAGSHVISHNLCPHHDLMVPF